jgi:hypothetical protein
MKTAAADCTPCTSTSVRIVGIWSRLLWINQRPPSLEGAASKMP